MKSLLTALFLVSYFTVFSQLDIITGYQYKYTSVTKMENWKEVTDIQESNNTTASILYTVPGEKIDFETYFQFNWLTDIYDPTFGIAANFAKINGIPVLATGVEYSGQRKNANIFLRGQYEYKLDNNLSAFGRVDAQFIDGVNIGDAWRLQVGFRFCILK